MAAADPALMAGYFGDGSVEESAAGSGRRVVRDGSGTGDAGTGIGPGHRPTPEKRAGACLGTASANECTLRLAEAVSQTEAMHFDAAIPAVDDTAAAAAFGWTVQAHQLVATTLSTDLTH